MIPFTNGTLSQFHACTAVYGSLYPLMMLMNSERGQPSGMYDYDHHKGCISGFGHLCAKFTNQSLYNTGNSPLIIGTSDALEGNTSRFFGAGFYHTEVVHEYGLIAVRV